jgi:TetR/AcrR family transcriptional regulator, cholesterol catabolism regulator
LWLAIRNASHIDAVFLRGCFFSAEACSRLIRDVNQSSLCLSPIQNSSSDGLAFSGEKSYSNSDRWSLLSIHLSWRRKSTNRSLLGGFMPKGVPLTEENQNIRRHEVFNASVSLFLEKGFQATSMEEIARAAGMGKSTLYDYFKTKDEILISFFEDEIIDLIDRVKQIASQDLPATARLHQVLRVHLDYLLANKEFYLKMTYEVQRLALDSQKRIQARRHAYQDLICGLIDEAVREGAFRPVNSLLATRTILSLLTPAVYTSRPTGTPEQMMDEALDIFYHGVTKQT